MNALNTITPTKEEIRTIAQEGTYHFVPIKRDILADSITTIEAFRALSNNDHHCFMLESAEPEQRTGRYSFIGVNPFVELTCTNGHLKLTYSGNMASADTTSGDTVSEDPAAENTAFGSIASVVEKEVRHPGDTIRHLIAQNAAPQLEGFPPFAGGLVGFFSYDYLKYAEPTLQNDQISDDFNDVDLMGFSELVVFDTYTSRISLIARVAIDDIDDSYQRAVNAIDAMERLLKGTQRRVFPPLQMEGDLAPRFSKAEYCAMVNKAKQHIFDGDIFQVVLSNPLTAKATGSLFDTYRILRSTNPSPYMFYFASDNLEVAGASPETLGKLTNGELETYPLAGTRPRGKTPEEDEALEEGLLTDEKEIAEHTMLVDLGRNDLGRIAELGTVHVDSYLNVLRFSHVMHLGSTVTAHIAKGKDAVDAIDSILPAGTLSGAPKIEACHIIQELEGSTRGIYGGAIGYLDFSGNMDTCIGIRLVYKKHGTVCVQSGAGIVADSIPEHEYQECINKAQAVVEALHIAEGGLE